MKVKSESEVAQSCPTLSDSMDCSLPGSSVHGIFQARVLECGAIAFSDQGILAKVIKRRSTMIYRQCMYTYFFNCIYIYIYIYMYVCVCVGTYISLTV